MACRKPTSTYGAPSITAGANHPGIEHDATTASTTLAGGAPGDPNATRSPVR